ncbi:MAG TPA: TIGR03936 family radical SAM-associated protein [Jatrophihabitans sp.]|jgi:radical SAM-linked protein|nr:TIGR03936 family radical SAM-associated protein [Jatrophihabitans sp.]
MARRQPEGPAHVAPVQRIRLQYAKRGRLRFCSHRDFARAFERSLRRAEVPMAYSAGFHPHPRISYVGAAPTGVGSEAEYLEIALARRCEPEQVRAALDAVLPDGLDIVRALDVEDCRPGSLTEQMHASVWQLELAADPAVTAAALARLLAAESVTVDRLTKDGLRSLEVRAPIVAAEVSTEPGNDTRAILRVVVRQVTPTVRPDDVLTALRAVAGFAPSQPPRATRLAQGPVDDAGLVTDPLCSTELPVSRAATEH